MSAAEVVARARAAVGTPFRLHGRGDDGLDCVGLVGRAFAVAVPTGYRLRSFDLGAVARVCEVAGLVAVDVPVPGDLIAMASAPRQLHLAIVTDAGCVHADAVLAHVVERPGAPPWPMLACWRMKGE